MIPLNWHQDDPFNYACPLVSPQSPFHTKAGCVAIAGAHMLYYLHDYLGVPETSPTLAVPQNNPPGYTFSNESDSTWVNMYPSTDPLHFAAYLIGKVGQEVGMQYDELVSLAVTENLVDSTFLPRGIYCEFSDYDVTGLIDNLDNDLPVIISGKTTAPSGSRHSFIVDGFIKMAVRYTYYYEWHYLFPGEHHVHHPSFYYEQEFLTPYMSSVYINWGESYISNSGLYSIDGDWIAGSNNYISTRRMISNFELLTQ